MSMSVVQGTEDTPRVKPSPLFNRMANDIADCYRDASLAGAEMRQAADSIEAFRAALSNADAPYGAWDEIDDAVGRAFARGHLPALLHLREQFQKAVIEIILSGVREALAADSEAGCRAYIRECARAICRWRSDVQTALANENVPAHPAHAASVETARAL